MKKAMTRGLTLFGSILLVLFFSSAAFGQCKKLLGRDREQLCTGEAAFNSCVTQLKAGTYDVCVQEGKPESRVHRATPEAAEADLVARGCMKLNDNVYKCFKDTSLIFCRGYENYFRLFVTFPKPGETVPTLPITSCRLDPVDLTLGDVVNYVGPLTNLELKITPQSPEIKNGANFVLPGNDAAACNQNKCTFSFGIVVARSQTTGRLDPYVELRNYDVLSGNLIHYVGNNLILNHGEPGKTIVLPVNLKIGLNKLTFTVDPQNKITETNEGNNAPTSVNVLVKP